jgi:hypothetical protein
MSELIEIINSLEKKVAVLLNERAVDKQNYHKLLEELDASDHYSRQLENELLKWEEKYNSLKMASSMLGGGNNSKTDAKRKINSLIKELDYCIAQLSE